MNERIRELAKQAGYKPLPGFDFANSLEEVFIKKFAELIVRECADIAIRLYKSYPREDVLYDIGYTTGIKSVAKEITEHFGIEE